MSQSSKKIQSQISKASDILKDGGLVVAPTDTLFGVLAHAFDAKAVEKVYQVKGREKRKSCIILIARPEDVVQFDVILSEEELYNARKMWSQRASTTLILPLTKKGIKKWKYLHRGTDSLAFRVPSTRNCRGRELKKMLQRSGPLIAPSANKEGQQPAETTTQARDIFGDAIDLYITHHGRLKGAPSIISIGVTGDNIIR